MEVKNWTVQPSKAAANTINPIRAIVDRLDMKSVPKDKEFISLSIGDPTKHLPVPYIVKHAVMKSVEEGENNGYFPSHGRVKARESIAKFYRKQSIVKGVNYTRADVVIASGCSGAIELAMGSLLDEGDNILLPRPGFPLYTTICGRYGFKPRFYNLLPEENWEVDLDHLESQIDERTKAILINNPSNPCGSVFTKEHLTKVCQLAYKHKLPILADEIYANMTFKGHKFYSCTDVTNGPVYVLGGLAKQYLAPGWRVGWILIHDPEDKLQPVRQALIQLSQLILGANSICQGAIPMILSMTPQYHYTNLNRILGTAAEILYAGLSSIPQLRPCKPQGAMYLMVEIFIDDMFEIEDDVVFCQGLLKEEAISVLPGVVFGCPNFFRVVLCPPPAQLQIAVDRIANFCRNHSNPLVSRL